MPQPSQKTKMVRRGRWLLGCLGSCEICLQQVTAATFPAARSNFLPWHVFGASMCQPLVKP